MKTLTTLALVALLSAPAALAQGRPEVGVGYDVDREAAYVGAGMRIPLASLPIVAAPHIDYYFIDNAVALQANLDGLYSFPGNSFSPYIGAGLAFAYTNVGKVSGTNVDPDADTEVGVNFLFGANINGVSTLRPYVQARLTAGTDGGGVGVGVGLNF